MSELNRLLFCVGFFFLLAVGITHAQKSGTLRGRIEDPSGARISGTFVNLKNEDSGATLGFKTDADGEFIARDIPFGHYTVQVEREGFHRLSKPVLLVSDGTTEVELTMELSAVATSVEVRASREELLETLSPGAVTVVYPDDTKGEFKSLPDLLDQIPGVYVRRVAGPDTGYTTASIRGSAPTQVNIYIDGIPFNLASEAAADLSTLPINDVERIEIYRGDVPARFSGAPIGGAINIVTKKPTSFSFTGSAGARTLGGRQFSLAMNGPVLGGKFLFGADEERSEGNFNYTNYLVQEYQTLMLPASSPYGAVTYCQAFPSAGTGSPCNLPTGRTRLNDSSSKDNLLMKWQNDRFSAKWSYLYMNRKLPYGLNEDARVDVPSAGPAFTDPRNQVQKQTEGVLGWNENFGKLTTSVIANLMDQDKVFTYLDGDPLDFNTQYNHYHTRRYGTEADLIYQLGEHGPVTQRFELHGDWLQETLHAVANNMRQSDAGGFPTFYRRHTVDFQLQDTITLRFLHNLEITPVGRMQRLTGPTVGNNRTPFAKPNGNSGWIPTASVALKERFGHGWQAYSSFGKYVRYPSIYEIYGDGIYIIPRTNSDGSSDPLQAEVGRTLDAGIGWDGIFTEKLSGHTRLNFFRRTTGNNITLLENPEAAYYENTGDTINRGIEFEGSLHRGNFASLQAAMTVQDGRYTGNGYYEFGYATPLFPAPGFKIPTLNSPFVNGDARLDLHFFRGGALTTFFETKYVGQNIIGITPTQLATVTGAEATRYDGKDVYERPLTTFDMGAHWKMPHGGTLSGGVTDLVNQGPKQQVAGNFLPPTGEITAIWYTCSTTGTTYISAPPSNVCPPSAVVTDTVSAPVKQNVYFPQQGRTLYVLMSWDFNGRRRRTK